MTYLGGPGHMIPQWRNKSRWGPLGILHLGPPISRLSLDMYTKLEIGARKRSKFHIFQPDGYSQNRYPFSPNATCNIISSVLKQLTEYSIMQRSSGIFSAVSHHLHFSDFISLCLRHVWSETLTFSNNYVARRCCLSVNWERYREIL